MGHRLVFVHGVGSVRNPASEKTLWLEALSVGARASGHTRAAERLPQADTIFAHYADLFRPVSNATPQGEGRYLPRSRSDEEAIIASELLAEAIDAQLERQTTPTDERALRRARARLVPKGQSQGVGNPVRQLLNACTTLLDCPPLRRGIHKMTASNLFGSLTQVARYLSRNDMDELSTTLDARVRDRVKAAIGSREAVVVAHSLGSVVALEALQEHAHAVRLFVTIGSPIGMRAVVKPRLRPQPLVTPDCVREWLNFWDRDDLVAARPLIEKDFEVNSNDIGPTSVRVDSDGLWVHGATTYLRQPGVAGPIVAALYDDL